MTLMRRTCFTVLATASPIDDVEGVPIGVVNLDHLLLKVLLVFWLAVRMPHLNRFFIEILDHGFEIAKGVAVIDRAVTRPVDVLILRTKDKNAGIQRVLPTFWTNTLDDGEG